MQPDKLKKLVEKGGITNDKELALFTVADEITTKLDTLSEAQKDTTQAIKDIPQQDIQLPEYPKEISINNFPLQEKVEEVSVKNFPNIQKVEVTNLPKKEKEDTKIYDKLNEISKKEIDLSPVVSAIKEIEKPDTFEIPESMVSKSGRLKVEVDKVGSGGGYGGGISGPVGLKNVLATPVNPATEEKQDDIISSLTAVVDTPEFFEDTSFVTGDSPVTLDINAALGRNATSGWIKNDGAGNFTFSFSVNGTDFGDEITLKDGEIMEWDKQSVDSVKITWVADSSYRVLAI